MFRFLRKSLKIWLVSDGTDTITQSRELAKNISNNIFEFNRLGANSSSSYPALVIGVGYNVTDTLLGIKARSQGKTKIAIILDPLKNHSDFDFIILPSYEPYNIQGDNIIYTTGLINFVNEGFLKQTLKNRITRELLKKLKQKNLMPPYTALVIGGKHTGGDVSVKDTEIISDRVNEIIQKKGGSLLITNSRRTESSVYQRLKEMIKVSSYFYDYHLRETENYYPSFLSVSDEVIVTGESVRMLSEAVSSGRKVRIYKPLEVGFQYIPLIEELYKKNLAVDLNNKNFDDLDFPVASINEAERVAKIIKSKFI